MELGGRKANLVTDMQSLGQVKLKKSRNVQACSLFSLSSLFSGKGKKKTSFLFFSFSWQQVCSGLLKSLPCVGFLLFPGYPSPSCIPVPSGSPIK